MDSVTEHARKAGKARMDLLDDAGRKALASLGGLARLRKLSARQRSSSARKAAKARWNRVNSVKNADMPANVPASNNVDVNPPL